MKTLHSALLNDNYFEDFYLCFCEKQEYAPGTLSDMWMRDHHTICYVISGKGNIRFGRQSLPLSAGQGVWIPPGRACRYQAALDAMWHCLRIGFSGKRVEDVLRELNFHEPGRRFFATTNYSWKNYPNICWLLPKGLWNKSFCASPSFMSFFRY
ncbi:MAG: hypothetical protein HFG55_13575 [Lachnospiraceae bacterium]|nr:hypothetical protein [Lachnospiraceae bacterium]